MTAADEAPTLKVGDLVVIPAEPARGVGRLERFVPSGGDARSARVFFYDQDQGRRDAFGVFALSAVRPAPPGPWPVRAATDEAP